MFPIVSEYLQEVNITTQAGRLLRLTIGELQGEFCLYGDYLEIEPPMLGRVAFPATREANAKALLQKWLALFVQAMSGKGDAIAAVHNPCNAAFVTQAEQEDILAALSVSAAVTVN